MRASFNWATAIATLAAAPAVAAHPEDNALNAVYDAVAQAKAEGSAQGFAGTFAADVLLIDPRMPAAMDGKEFHSRMGSMGERLRADGVTVEARYRVERRAVSGDVAVDSGLMRQAVARPGGPAMTQYSHFLVTLQKQKDGGWRIIGDASMPSTEEAWAKATRTEGLKYDA